MAKCWWYTSIGEARRLRVSQLRALGHTVRSICAILSSEGMVNPRTRKPFSIGAIESDLQALEQEWLAEAAKSAIEHKSRLLAETREAYKRAWEVEDVGLVLKCIALEMRLLGLDKQRIVGVSLDLDFNKLSDTEIKTIADGADPLEVLGPARLASVARGGGASLTLASMSGINQLASSPDNAGLDLDYLGDLGDDAGQDAGAE